MRTGVWVCECIECRRKDLEKENAYFGWVPGGLRDGLVLLRMGGRIILSEVLTNERCWYDRSLNETDLRLVEKRALLLLRIALSISWIYMSQRAKSETDLGVSLLEKACKHSVSP